MAKFPSFDQNWSFSNVNSGNFSHFEPFQIAILTLTAIFGSPILAILAILAFLAFSNVLFWPFRPF